MLMRKRCGRVQVGQRVARMETVVVMQHYRRQRYHGIINMRRRIAKCVAATRAAVAIAAAYVNFRRQKRRRGRVVMRRCARINNAKASVSVCAMRERVHGVILHRMIEWRVRAARMEEKVDVFFSL